MVLVRAGDTGSAWVAADPFRAHLAHVCAVTGLPWQVVALHAGVSVRMAEGLLHGRRGRRLRRIPRDCAQRILALSPAMVASSENAWVSAQSTGRRLAWLLSRGVPAQRLATRLGCSAERIIDLAEECESQHPGTVTQGFAVQVVAACEIVVRATNVSLGVAA